MLEGQRVQSLWEGELGVGPRVKGRKWHVCDEDPFVGVMRKGAQIVPHKKMVIMLEHRFICHTRRELKLGQSRCMM